MTRYLFTLLLLIFTSLPSVLNAADTANGQAPLQDEFLDKLAGQWNLTRTVRGTTKENKVDAEWVLDHQFLRVHMKDVASPPKYEADVYIGYDKTRNRYVAHWMDTYGGGFSAMGFGVRDGNSLPLIFEDADGTLRNTFTYDPATQTWTSLIVQKSKAGREWKTFAEDSLKRP